MPNNEKLKQLMFSVMYILGHHVGEENAIDMGDLYRRIFGKPYTNKINGTRALRTVIMALRNDGMPVGSSGAGYYIMHGKSEIDDFCKRFRNRALKALAQEARIRKVSLPELMGQIHLTLTTEETAPHA